MDRVQVKTLFVSSENRDTQLYPNGNSYVLHLNTPVKDIKRIELLHASVPNTIYNLTNGSNVIGIQNTSCTSSHTHTYFSIPEGFYSASGLASEITNAVSNLTGVTMTYLSNEGKYIFTRTGNNFSVDVPSTELQGLVGFTTREITSYNVPTTLSGNLAVYSDSALYRGKEIVKSNRIVNLHPNEGIFLDIEELRTEFTEDAQKIENTANYSVSGKSMRNSFGIIPMDVNGGSIKRFKKTSDYDMVIDYAYPINRLERLTVRWVDKNGDLVNFNGANDNSFVLRLHTLRVLPR